MSIDTFRASVGNFVRPTRFRVFPGIMINDRNFEFLCKAASLPAANLGMINVPYQGRMIPDAGDTTFDPWTITIQQDERFIVRNQLMAWKEMINGNATNISLLPPQAYKTDIVVEQLNQQNGIIASYRLVGAFPINIGEIQLSYEMIDQIEEYQVTFALAYWTQII